MGGRTISHPRAVSLPGARVAACATDRAITTLAAVHEIVTLTTERRVCSAAGADDIFARAAIDVVSTVESGHQIGPRTARDSAVVLVAFEHVATAAATEDVALPFVEVQIVVTGAAEKHILPNGAAAARHDIAPRAADESVTAACTEDAIVVRPAEQSILVLQADEAVVAWSTADHVVALPADDDVASTEPDDDVIARVPRDHVIAIAPDDRGTPAIAPRRCGGGSPRWRRGRRRARCPVGG